MNLTNNTILITGGGSGIGRGLAEAFHALGNKIIIAGRRQQALEETTDANPGMAFVTLDINDPNAIRSFAADVTELHPTLNVLINNAGIMRPENLKAHRSDRPHPRPFRERSAHDVCEGLHRGNDANLGGAAHAGGDQCGAGEIPSFCRGNRLR
jgi:NAD(P)-dependent dehydrogenase (short-subunit alcohol dehydrogenase family)